MERSSLPLTPVAVASGAPVIKSWKELGIAKLELEKAARPWTIREKGNIDHGQRNEILAVGQTTGSYGEYFRGLPEDKQREILGPGRLQRLTSGDIDWNDLVNSKTGQIRTLQELDEAIAYATSHNPLQDRTKFEQWYADPVCKLKLFHIPKEDAAGIGAKTTAVFSRQIQPENRKNTILNLQSRITKKLNKL